MLPFESINQLFNPNLEISSDDFTLRENDVHIWICQQDQIVRTDFPILSLLDDNERAKMRSLKHQQTRNRYVKRHAILRLLLAGYLNKRSDQIKFDFNQYGKPYISDSNLHFNISYSQQMAIMAFSQHNIGIDIEALKPIGDFELVAKYHFATTEYDYLLAQAHHDHLDIFYKIWTAKEAFIKCVGDGLQIPLQSFEIPLPIARHQDEVMVKYSADSDNKYLLYNIPMDDAFIASLVTSTPVKSILKYLR